VSRTKGNGRQMGKPMAATYKTEVTRKDSTPQERKWMGQVPN